MPHARWFPTRDSRFVFASLKAVCSSHPEPSRYEKFLGIQMTDIIEEDAAGMMERSAVIMGTDRKSGAGLHITRSHATPVVCARSRNQDTVHRHRCTQFIAYLVYACQNHRR